MARATTDRNNGGQVISIDGVHNHEVIRERRKNGELRELLAQRQAERVKNQVEPKVEQIDL